MIISILKFKYFLDSLKFRKLPRRKIEKYKILKLKEIISYAYKYSSYYREIFKKNDINPKKINSLKDLKKIPISKKIEIRKNSEKVYSKEYLPYFSVLKRMPSFIYMRSTSGTTGNPFKIYFDEQSKLILDAIYARALVEVGYNPFKQLFYFWWQQPKKKEIYNFLGLFRKFFVPSTLTFKQQLSLMNKVKPEYIYYYPSHLYFISRLIKNENIELTFNPRLIITHAEILEEKMRKRIEETFNVLVFDQYGSNEFNRIAYECKERNGYHIAEDSVIVEIVDENEDAGEGETGKVIITGLLNKATPLIRYEVGDFAKKAIEKKHNCGNNLEVLIESVEGRIEHYVNGKTQKEMYRYFLELLDSTNLNYFQVFLNEDERNLLILADKEIEEKIKKKIEEELNVKVEFRKENIKVNNVTGKCLIFERI